MAMGKKISLNYWNQAKGGYVVSRSLLTVEQLPSIYNGQIVSVWCGALKELIHASE